LRSVFFMYCVGLVALIIVALARAEPLPPLADLAWGGLAGLFGMGGVVFLYQGFATGRMGIVAPVSGVLAVTIPVIFNGFTEGLPQNVQLAGFGVALVGIWLLARPERLGKKPAGLGWAIIAGIGFGSFFIVLDQVSKTAVFWPLVAGRTSAIAVMVVLAIATHRSILPQQAPVRLYLLAGVLDVAGNVFFLLAVQSGRLDIASVLASLYPAVTAILARVMIKEHLSSQQIFGVSAAFLAIVLITG